MKTYKGLVTDFLIHSFVDEYEFTKRYVEHLNKELKHLRIPFQYTYDEFCIELMGRFLDIVDRACHSFREVQERFSDLVYRAIREMRKSKVQEISTVQFNEW